MYSSEVNQTSSEVWDRGVDKWLSLFPDQSSVGTNPGGFLTSLLLQDPESNCLRFFVCFKSKKMIMDNVLYRYE